MSFFGRFVVGVLLGCATIAASGIGWTFQQPTYLIEKDATGVTSYTCDPSQTSCKANFDFSPSLPTEEPATHYSCLIDFGFGITGEENKCNPNTVEFPIGTWTVRVIVKKIADDSVVADGSLTVFRADDTVDPSHVTHTLEWQSPTYLLGIADTTLTEYSCDPKKPECKINPKVTPLLDGASSSKITCAITADFTLVATSDPCNPNTSTVPVGEHTLTIQLLQKKDNTILQTRTILLKNNPIVETIDPARITMTKIWQSPSSLLSLEDGTLSEYSCDPSKSECKINLLFTPLLDGAGSSQLTCEVTADFEIIPTSDPCNPNTSLVPIGEHILTIQILEKETRIALLTNLITLKNIPPEIEIIDPVRVSMDLAFQQPTYLLEKSDTALSTYSCDPSQPECKVNLQILPKLDGVESSLFDCHITTDFGLEFDDCNPAVFVVPVGDFSLTIDLIQKNSGTVSLTRTIAIHSPEKILGGGGSGSSTTSSTKNINTTPLDLSTVQIHIQTGLDAYEVCKTETCQVNFEAIVPTGVVCHWDFGNGTFETPETDQKCNPGYVKFSQDSAVILTVSDPAFSENIISKTYPVYRTKSPEISNEILSAHIGLQGKIGKNKKVEGSRVTCVIGSAEFCSINLTGEGSTGAKNYFWTFGDGESSDEKNPPAHKFPLGSYRVRLEIHGELGSTSTLFDIVVVKKLEEEIIPECEIDCPDLKGKIHISAVLPNPPHADTVEWIEIKNVTNENVSLKGCEISDDAGSYKLSGSLGSGKTLRLRQVMTGISLGNTHDELSLSCFGQIIDTFTWNFSIPSSYILRREVLQNTPKKGQVLAVIDGDTLDMMLDGKKTRIRLLGVDTPETVHPRKPVEKFGKQASDFTKKILEGKTVWITFDHEPIDHYGRTLGYIWLCSGDFSEENCTLFNARLVTDGYARMERRFEFIRYDLFNDLEKEAKKQKVGIWGDSEVAKVMNETAKAETELLQAEQEKAFLELQAELLELEIPVCEEGNSEEECEPIKIPEWREVTEQLTAFNASAKKSGVVTFSGRTWADFPLTIEIREGDTLIRTIDLTSDDIGEFHIDWYPEKTGEYTVQLTLRKAPNPAEAQEPFSVLSEIITGEKEATVQIDPNLFSLQKPLIVGIISDHFLEPLAAKIVVQGAMTDNRWVDGDIFHCRSRGSCSVNVTVEVNRSDAVIYEWLFPEMGNFSGKNPTSIKFGYGEYLITLKVSDLVTGETITKTITVDHRAIPKKASINKPGSSKYTLDLKDIPQDIGGGFGAEKPVNPFLMSLFVLLFLGGVSLLLFRQKSE